MESRSSKVELIKHAIKQVIEEAGGSNKSSSDDDDDRHSDDNLLLSKLMSQLEKLEIHESEADSELTKPKSKDSSTSKDKEEDEEDNEDKIVKELKEVKRQNLITHCLVSVMILLTVVWQVSEVSIILKLKDGVSHPFRSLGSMFKSMIKPPITNGNNEDTESSSSLVTSDLIESSPVLDCKIPELPCIELPKIDFGFNGED